VFVVLAVTMDEFTFAYAAFPILALVYVSLALVSVGCTISCMVRRAWWSALLPLATMILVATSALALVSYILEAQDIARFKTVRPNYDAQVAKLPKDGRRYKEFNWGGMLFASRGVVYDETDEIALPANKRSAAWTARLRNTDLMCGTDDIGGIAIPLGNHYYLTSFGC
jgi:hypothetical protein